MERFMLVQLHKLQVGVMHLLARTSIGIEANLAGDDDPLAGTVALTHVGFMKLKPQAPHRPGSIADDHLIESPTATGSGAAGDQDRACKRFLRSDLQLANRLEIGAVLIATGQQGQRVTDRLDPQTPEHLRSSRPYAFEELNGLTEDIDAWRRSWRLRGC